jgi:3-oxoacyl-(acyl-carrier-protein) synthase
MRAALDDAGLAPSAIGYINAHGTATPVGDVAETESIREVFGESAGRLAVSSTKALHGHLLGASGAVEFIAALMALRTGTLPPTCHLAKPDPKCDLDYVPNAARHGVPLEAVMSNSFAFGGTNAVLVARRAQGG